MLALTSILFTRSVALVPPRAPNKWTGGIHATAQDAMDRLAASAYLPQSFAQVCSTCQDSVMQALVGGEQRRLSMSIVRQDFGDLSAIKPELSR